MNGAKGITYLVSGAFTVLLNDFVSSLQTIAIGSWIRDNTVDFGNFFIDLSGPENIFYFFWLKMSSQARPGRRHVV